MALADDSDVDGVVGSGPVAACKAFVKADRPLDGAIAGLLELSVWLEGIFERSCGIFAMMRTRNLKLF